MEFNVSIAMNWILFIALFPIQFFWYRRAYRIFIKRDFSEVALKNGEPPENPASVSYDNICTIMFLNPEVAAVGLNEQQCIERGLSIKVVKLDFSCITRAIAMRKTQGFFKIIVIDDAEMKILGMRAIGEHASSAIQAIGLLIKMNESIEVLADLVHPHPSIIEGIQECVRMLMNKSIFKSAVFKDAMQCYRRRAELIEDLQEL